MTNHLWDYTEESLKKSRHGKVLLLERQINYGVYLHDKEKVALDEVKRLWHELKLEPKRRRLFEVLIWGK